MFLIAFFIGCAIAVLIKFHILHVAEENIQNPGKFWHYLHIGINLSIGFALLFLFWSWLIGAVGLGFITVGIASIYIWIIS